MEKGSENFKKVIEAELNLRAAEDPLFAESLKKPHKELDQCINYIMKSVQASGMNGFTEDEIFKMAVHYYDEDTIDMTKPVSATVVVNHHVKLTEEEIAEAKEKAIKDIYKKQEEKITKKNSRAGKSTSNSPGEGTGSLF